MASDVREELRTLVREEIARALKILALEAENVDGYETGELESAGLRAVAKGAEAAAEAVATEWHGWRCNSKYGGECGYQCETNWEKN